MGDSKKILFLRIVGIGMLILALFAALLYVSRPSNNVEPMEVIFVETTDDADCTILINRDKNILIDTGEEVDFIHIKEILDSYQIKKIDCLILTHPDKDHIGSAYKLAENYQIDLVIKPYYAKENERYDTLNQYLDEQRIHQLVLSRNRQFIFGDIRILVYPPNDFEYNNDNNYSLAVKVEHQDITMFFTGDAEKKRTEELLSLSLPTVDLFKASYHGRDYEGAEALLDALNPDKVVVTAKKAGNDVNKRLIEMNCDVYTTLESDAYFVSDGHRINKEDWK